MNAILRAPVRAVVLGALLITPSAMAANTPGSVALTATLNDSAATTSTKHWSVVWVTTGTGTFIKTLGIRGNKYAGNPSVFWTTHWNDHCSIWYSQRNGSTALAADGYTSATALTYSPPNSPINLTWNCLDANNNLVADGTYKFWIQYSENDDTADGPCTTNGLTWTKGPGAYTSGTLTQSPNFTNMSVVWTPAVVTPNVSVAVAPASVAEDGASNLVYTFTRTDTSGVLTTNFSVSGSATFNTDYTQSGAAGFGASSGTVAFAAGSATATVTIDPTPDSSVEPDETVVLTVTAGTGYNVGAPAAATGTIGNDDTAYSSWASVLPAGQAGAGQTPQNDGVTNLLKFACNLDPSKPDTRTLTVGANGVAGLPGQAVVGGKLRMEFLRRKASTNPGIAYLLQFSSDLGASPWSGVDVTTTPAGTSIDATWERVVVDDTVVGGNRFGRLRVVQSP